MFTYQLSFLDALYQKQVAYVLYKAEDDMGALEQARLQYFYLPAELRRGRKLVARFQQKSAPVEPRDVRHDGRRRRR